MWLGLGQPVVPDKESAAQSDEDTQGRPPGKGNNTFFSHREIGVTAGFAGSDHLLEQGSLEIWQLSGRKTSKWVKTTRYGGGGWGVGKCCGPWEPDVPSKPWHGFCGGRQAGRGRAARCRPAPSAAPRSARRRAPRCLGCVVRGQGKGRRRLRAPNCILVSCQGDTLAERVQGPLSPVCWRV